MFPKVSCKLLAGCDVKLRIWDLETANEIDSIELDAHPNQFNYDACLWWGEGDTHALLMESYYNVRNYIWK